MLAIYCRISRNKEDGKDTSIDTQKSKGLAFAIANNFDAYNVYIDEGISGQKDEEDRPAFAQMLLDIKSKKITAVWTFDQSRLERSPRIWHSFLYIIGENNVNYYPSGKKADLDDPTTQLVTGVLSLTNQMFAKLTGIKVKNAIKANLERGKYHGMTAFGYTKDDSGYLIIHPEQAEVVKRIFALSLQGIGTYTIANILNDDEVPTKYNDYEGLIKKKDRYTKEVTAFDKKNVRWRGGVIRDMIINTIYKGKLKVNGEFYDVPPILDVEYWQEVNDNLANNRKKVGKREEYKYLLNGLIWCENCGKPMRGKKREKGKDSAYKCAGGKGCRGVNIEKTETFIIKHLFHSKELKNLLNNAPAVSNDKVADLKIKLNKKEEEYKRVDKKLKRLLLLAGDDDNLDDEEFTKEYKATRTKKAAMEKEIKAVETEIIQLSNNYAVTNFNNKLEGFDVNQGFDVVKTSIHSLISNIKIAHFKQQKEGYYIIRIEYKNFGDVSLFTSNYRLLNWNWGQYYRNGFTNAEQENDDKKLFHYVNAQKPESDFIGYETTAIMHEQVKIFKNELITFN